MTSRMKKCCRCKLEKSTSEFGKRSRNRDGLEYYCKECKLLESHEYRERANELARQRYAENKSFYVAKASRHNFKKRGNALPAKYADLLVKTPKKIKMWADTPEKNRNTKRANPQKYRDEYKKWSSTENGKLLNSLKSQRRRARVKNVPNTLTKDEVYFLYQFQSSRCACCHGEFSPTNKYEIDHVVPISVGGWTTLENTQLLCRSCNASKQNKTIRYIPEITDSIRLGLRSNND